MQNTKQVLDGDNKDIFKRKREFYLDEDLVDKIDSIEYGAQVNKIEEIEVNGVPVEPDESKTVHLNIPRVIDALTSDSSTDALSARMGKYLYSLYQQTGVLYRYRGSVATFDDLPESGNQQGDVYNILDTGMNYAWTGTEWDALGGSIYTAGANISINNNEISAVDTTYTAGEGISIGQGLDYSAMRGPCQEGYHIPESSELRDFYNKVSAFGLTLEDVGFPTYGFLGDTSGNLNLNYDGAEYRSCNSERKPEGYEHTEYLAYSLSKNGVGFEGKGYGHYIRPFSDEPIIPDNSWTIIYDGSSTASGAGIFHNSSLGVISYSSDGTTWKTIADKNLGAENVYVNGDGYSQINCGGFFQRGNCYMFPYTGAVDKSSTLVAVSGYGPGNYYSSSTFVKTPSSGQSRDRASDTGVGTEDLRGGKTGVVTIDNVISNTGVLSVNGQTGDVTVESGGKQSYFKRQDEYDALPASKTTDGNLYIIVNRHPYDLMAFNELIKLTPAPDAIINELNRFPQRYVEYYNEDGDLDYAHLTNDDDEVIPVGKYFDYYRFVVRMDTYLFFETDMTEQELEDFENDPEMIEAILNGEWFSTWKK